jgi:exopolysaccharide biosynthesis polyprenyl glycosylphosphotransferase
MTPPVQEHALETPRTSVAIPTSVASRRVRLLPGDVVSLVDTWVLLAVLWAARAATGSLDPAATLFGLVAFGLLVSPTIQRERLNNNALDDAGTILRRVAISYAIASGISIAVGVGEPRILLAVAGAAAPTLALGRGISYKVERAVRSRGEASRTLIVGGGEIARRVIATLEEHQDYGLDVIGVADDDPKFEASELGARLVGGLADVPDLVASHNVDVVIVAFSNSNQASMVNVMRSAMMAGASVWVVPRFFELGAAGNSKDHLWGIPVVRLNPPARSRPEWLLKRAFDFVLAAVGCLLLAPVLAAIAFAVLVESGRPILLRQRRVGLDGRPFDIYKFRSMRVADDSVEATEWAASEARTTRVGQLLRKTSLDELPQLFNILKGEMSLVGPRPERPYFVDLFSDLYPHYGSRHRLPAGLTGWAQIHGLRGDTSIEERAVFDNYYIENWSLTEDLKILLRTMPKLSVSGRNRKEG